MDQELPFRVVTQSVVFNDETFAFCQLLFEKDGEYFTCQKAERQPASASRLLDLFAEASLVPHAFYRTPVPTTFACTQARELEPNMMYLKVAEPLTYSKENILTAKGITDDQIRELRACEVLLQNPHPNICRYYGYLPSANGDYIRGLCFERQETLLFDAVIAGAQFPPSFLDGVHEALKHLHSLGYAHSDINPGNIMISKAGEPILIDFDSSLPLGLKVKKGKSPGWEYEGRVSAKENDLWALAKLREWIAGKRE
ncbi:hypothetical protein FB45DRAFT_209951 [Roridomyces roridus]|uniref:Protein kinase domain-containing protein n=1 Tax=Roridomyces roridus TaxID=1738132 RepID=A0AAD7CIA0_9AGAR|nr:hypothetical protein FB45DRAFT_209951 [Roridomyces roridus]